MGGLCNLTVSFYDIIWLNVHQADPVDLGDQTEVSVILQYT